MCGCSIDPGCPGSPKCVCSCHQSSSSSWLLTDAPKPAPKWIVLDASGDREGFTPSLLLEALRRGSCYRRLADEIERQLEEGPCVVVIDPDDVQQVRALRTAWAHDTTLGDEGMAKALRSLLPTPKPPEQMGLGAVIEDADGDRWVRAASDHQPWFHMTSDGRAAWLDYNSVDAVKVLSEGVVTP